MARSDPRRSLEADFAAFAAEHNAKRAAQLNASGYVTPDRAWFQGWEDDALGNPPGFRGKTFAGEYYS